VIKELLEANEFACKISADLVKLFNTKLSKMCEYYNPDVDSAEKVLFMNYSCRHPHGIGHCCVATCPLKNCKEGKDIYVRTS